MRSFFEHNMPEDSNVMVELTEELYGHMIEMYKATDWDAITDEDLSSIIIPANDGEGLDNPEFKNHIGEYIYLSRYGDPVDVFSMDSFIDGIEIRTADEMLSISGDQLQDAFSSRGPLDFDAMWGLPLAIILALKSHYSTNTIFKMLSGE